VCRRGGIDAARGARLRRHGEFQIGDFRSGGVYAGTIAAGASFRIHAYGWRFRSAGAVAFSSPGSGCWEAFRIDGDRGAVATGSAAGGWSRPRILYGGGHGSRVAIEL